jgi:hypothetical protein
MNEVSESEMSEIKDLDKVEEEWKEAEMAKISAVIEKREPELYRYPNVVGLGASYRTKAGKPTDELCLVVYVEKKVPATQLSARDLIPREIDGIKTDVVETGRIEAL